MNEAWLGVLFALGTSASWAFGNVLSQRGGRLVGPPRAMLWSMTAGATLSVPLALLLDERTASVTSSVAAWIAVAAVSGLMAYVGLFFAFANESLTIAVPVVSSWPIVSTLVAVAVLGESVNRAMIAGAAIVLAGVLLVATKDAGTSGSGAPVDRRAARIALLAGIVSSVGFGVMIPAMARVAPATGAFGATAIVYALAIAIALVGSRLVHTDMRPPPRAAWLVVLATGGVETLGFVCVAMARRFAPMTLVAPVASLSSTMTVLFAWLVLRDRPPRRAIVGAALACAGVVVLAR